MKRSYITAGEVTAGAGVTRSDVTRGIRTNFDFGASRGRQERLFALGSRVVEIEMEIRKASSARLDELLAELEELERVSTSL